MARKDITDEQVCRAYVLAKGTGEWPYELISRETGQPLKVCYRAIERAFDHDLIEFGTSLRSGWLTENGKKLISSGGY